MFADSVRGHEVIGAVQPPVFIQLALVVFPALLAAPAATACHIAHEMAVGLGAGNLSRGGQVGGSHFASSISSALNVAILSDTLPIFSCRLTRIWLGPRTCWRIPRPFGVSTGLLMNWRSSGQVTKQPPSLPRSARRPLGLLWLASSPPCLSVGLPASTASSVLPDALAG